jgi:hypothetical protein
MSYLRAGGIVFHAAPALLWILILITLGLADVLTRV